MTNSLPNYKAICVLSSTVNPPLALSSPTLSVCTPPFLLKLSVWVLYSQGRFCSCAIHLSQHARRWATDWWGQWILNSNTETVFQNICT